MSKNFWIARHKHREAVALCHAAIARQWQARKAALRAEAIKLIDELCDEARDEMMRRMEARG